MKPSIFIGSSSEALSLAKAIKRELSTNYHVEIWSEHLFELGEDTLNNLLRFIQCYDFAIFVVTGDDFSKSRGKNTKSPRDNVIFELGLFMVHWDGDGHFLSLHRQRHAPLNCHQTSWQTQQFFSRRVLPRN